MKIWLINQYNMPPEYGHLNRHFNFGKYLKRMGYEPTVFVGSFLHNTEIQMIEDDSLVKRYEHIDYPYYFIKTSNYTLSKLKRIYAMYEFYKNLLKIVKSFDKPDIILGSSAHPLAAIAAIKLGRRYGCQSIIEIRDLWPESFAAYNIIKKNNPLLKLLYAGEKWIYKKADKLVFTMEGGKDYIIEKGWDKQHGGPIDLNKIYHINNGVDLEAFNYNKEYYKLDDDDLNDNTTFKVIYTGSIRLVNQVGIILDVAKYLQDDGHNNIKFLIYGTGDQVDILKRRLKNESINNVYFKGRVDKKYIPYVTSKGDLNIVVGINRPLHRFGTSANKRFDYFASGKPTLATTITAYSLIKRYGAGSEVRLTEIESVANEIIRYKNMPKEQYNQYCINALKAAKDYDFKVLTEKLLDIINEQ
jgi:glycosyltransferase involved in cell wall biosynthesis